MNVGLRDSMVYVGASYGDDGVVGCSNPGGPRSSVGTVDVPLGEIKDD